MTFADKGRIVASAGEWFRLRAPVWAMRGARM